jgi:hypothetical protein
MGNYHPPTTQESDFPRQLHCFSPWKNSLNCQGREEIGVPVPSLKIFTDYQTKT